MQKKLFLLFVMVASMAGAASAADRRFDAFMGRVVGNQTTVTFGSGGTPIVTSSAGLGTPAIGNMGVTQAGSGVSVAGGVRMPVAGNGNTVGAVARFPVSRAAFLAGLGAAASNPLVALGLAVAAPSLIEWLDLSGVRVNPGVTGPQNAFLLKDINSCYENCYFWTYQWGGNFPTPQAICGKWTVSMNHPGSGYYNNDGGACMDGASVRYYFWRAGARLPDEITWLPKSMDDIAPYLDRPDAPALTPQVFVDAVQKAGIDPFGAQSPAVTLTGPASIPAQKTTTSEPTKLIPGTTTPAAPGTPVTDSGTKTTTTTGTTNITYNQNTATTTNTTTTTTNITNNVTNQTINEGDKVEETEQKEITVCGLPGTPACKIDETGTPEAKEDTAEADAKKALKPLDDLIANPQSALPTLPTINWAFTLPSGCAPIALPAFDPWLQEIDVCAFQPMFHDIMTFVWVLGGIFGAIGTFWRNTFSQG